MSIEDDIQRLVNKLPSGWQLEIAPARMRANPLEYSVSITDSTDIKVAIRYTDENQARPDLGGESTYSPDQALVHAAERAVADALLMHEKRMLRHHVGIYTPE